MDGTVPACLPEPSQGPKRRPAWLFDWVALAILLVTGLVMIAAEPARALLNPVFGLKMLLLFAALAVTCVTAGVIRRAPDGWPSTPARRRFARVSAVISSGLWVAILCAGRWIAYARTH